MSLFLYIDIHTKSTFWVPSVKLIEAF